MSTSSLAVALAPRQVKDLEWIKLYIAYSYCFGKRDEMLEEDLKTNLIKHRFDFLAKGVFFLSASGERIVYSEEGKSYPYPD